MHRHAAGFLVALGVVLMAGSAGAARIDRIEPGVLRLNSTFVVVGDGFGTSGDAAPTLVLAGRRIALDGTPREVTVRIPAVRVSDNQVRAPLPRGLVDDWTLDPARFEGTARLLGAFGETPAVPANFAVFPHDMLSAVVRVAGFESDVSTSPPAWALALALLAAALFCLLPVFALFAGIASWAERRVAGRIQNRIGPNRVGPQGILQWLADGLKCLLKEDFIPPKSMPILFRVGPYFPMLGVVLTFVTLPFGQALVVSDLDVGVYYVLAVTGFTVVGVLIGGFASANKWSLLGGFRSAAQIVSYEIPSGMSVLAVVALAGSLGFGSIVKGQGGFPWEWYLFHNPFTFVAFFLYFTAALAEGNRTPFDLPEAESELVSGYNTEYSGMRFVFYFFAEWGNLYVMSALMVALFLGGWQLPLVTPEQQALSLWFNLAGWALFTFKALFLVFVVIWIRWTLPRVRIDQLMTVCWKYLVPAGVVCFLGAAIWGTYVGPVAQTVSGLVLFGLGCVLAAIFLGRVARTVRGSRMPVRMNPWV